MHWDGCGNDNRQINALGCGSTTTADPCTWFVLHGDVWDWSDMGRFMTASLSAEAHSQPKERICVLDLCPSPLMYGGSRSQMRTCWRTLYISSGA